MLITATAISKHPLPVLPTFEHSWLWSLTELLNGAAGSVWAPAGLQRLRKRAMRTDVRIAGTTHRSKSPFRWQVLRAVLRSVTEVSACLKTFIMKSWGAGGKNTGGCEVSGFQMCRRGDVLGHD